MPEPETEQPVAKCAVEMHDGTPCGRRAYDDQARCICHSEKAGKDPEAFWRDITRMLECKNYDFTGFFFPPDQRGLWRTRFKGDVWCLGTTFRGAVSFRESVFQGIADFRRSTFGDDARFDDAKFHGLVDFTSATFHGEANFAQAVAVQSARFDKVTFDKLSSFHAATFGKVSFSRAHFGGTSYFAHATFASEVYFLRTVFVGPAQFWHSTFEKDTYFRGVMFNGGVAFSPATFQGAVRFYAVRFTGPAEFIDVTFEGPVSFVGPRDHWVFSSDADADFRSARFGDPENAHFLHVYLGRARLLGADIRHVDFAEVKWARRSGGRFAVWDELRPEDERDEKSFALIGRLYRQLKYNYEEQQHDPITAGDFHFGEMHMRRLSNPPKNCLLRLLKRNLSFLALYRWISGYGEDYMLALAWVVAVIVASALAFAYIPALALQPSASTAGSLPMQGFWSRLWCSVMCFLLRGDRPLVPVHPAGHYLSVAEGVIGPALIAMFVLALNRRFKR
jgi:uncharacterized protein YjbI with pentapeptide repeats